MKVVEARYTIRRLLKAGDYGKVEWEELSATVTADVDEDVEGDKLIKEARRVCISNSTAELQKKKNG